MRQDDYGRDVRAYARATWRAIMTGRTPKATVAGSLADKTTIADAIDRSTTGGQIA